MKRIAGLLTSYQSRQLRQLRLLVLTSLLVLAGQLAAAGQGAQEASQAAPPGTQDPAGDQYTILPSHGLAFSGISFAPATDNASPSAVSGAPQSLSENSQTTSQRSSPNRTGSAPLVEKFSFLIKDFKINHQAEVNNLNITVRYRYATGITNAEYPDFRLIAKDIEDFLTDYPNETDYWEILNKRITARVLRKYSSIVEVTSQMQVSPTSLDPYTRSSIVTRRRRHQGE